MSNSFSFVGRLGHDASLKQAGESQVLEFTAANDTGYKDRKVSSWYRCQLWGKQGVALQQYLVKGKQVFVVGELTLRPYKDKTGLDKLSADVRVHAIDLVGGREDGQAAPKEAAPAGTPAGQTPTGDSDSMPF